MQTVNHKYNYIEDKYKYVKNLIASIPSEWFLWGWIIGFLIITLGRRPAEGAMHLATAAKRLKRLKTAKGQLLEKVGMDLGLAPRPLGVGATSAWGWRHVGLGSIRQRWPKNTLNSHY
jgi:hypothetical protein